MFPGFPKVIHPDESSRGVRLSGLASLFYPQAMRGRERRGGILPQWVSPAGTDVVRIPLPALTALLPEGLQGDSRANAPEQSINWNPTLKGSNEFANDSSRGVAQNFLQH